MPFEKFFGSNMSSRSVVRPFVGLKSCLGHVSVELPMLSKPRSLDVRVVGVLPCPFQQTHMARNF